ncbi:type I polyketide synthase, partial [Streptomyces mirabilis]|uniref:type I polyketide synthase n=1 Tax=Streptomyces mirabilis TaxID=68239 RepID=UPI00332A1802
NHTHPHTTPLPTYPFQHHHYWLDPTPTTTPTTTTGLDTTHHPLLSASLTFASSDRTMLTGRMSPRTQQWLADHSVHGAVLFPGAGFVELALHAGQQTGHPHIAELTLEAPLVLSETQVTETRVELEEPEDGRRAFSVYARPEETDEPWTRHVTGVLSQEVSAPEPMPWPPEADPVDVAGFYERMAEAGIAYGPAFRGLREAWVRGNEVFAVIELEATDGFLLHPALLDSALHATRVQTDTDASVLPFSWTGISLFRPAVGELRVRLVRRGADDWSLQLADASGAPVASVASLVARPVSGEHVRRASGPLLRLEWQPVTLPVTEAMPVDVALLHVRPDSLTEVDPAEAARKTAERALVSVRDALAQQARVVVVTEGATTSEDPVLRLSGAAVWGLMRSVQAEYPGRVVLVDNGEAGNLASVIASGEAQVAFRDGRAVVPRLVRTVQAPDTDGRWGDGPVLVTGGSGALGRLVARHLVESCGVRELLLVSRRGEAAPGATELVSQLREFGATVEFAACDVSDRQALSHVIASTAPSAVVHCAGVVDDATLAGQSARHLQTVFAPKANAAWHLHELTKDLDSFVLFSSAAGVLGSAGQANYAAANAFLDALAELRRAQGQPAVSMAWGLWDLADGMVGELSETDRRRIARTGVLPIGAKQGLAMFDAALGSNDALVVPLLVKNAALQADDSTPSVLHGFVPAVAPSAAAPVSLRDRIGPLSGDKRRAALLEAVLNEVAAILGHASAAALDPGRSLTDLGFDSLTAVELRSRLSALTGLVLPATLVFDHPSSEALAAHLDGQLPGARPSLLEEIDRLEAALASPPDSTDHAFVTQRLTSLLTEWGRRQVPGTDRDEEVPSDAKTPEELMAFIDQNL